VSPKPAPILALALLVGLVAGVATAMVRNALDDRAQDPEEIEAGTGLPVFAEVSHSGTQEGIARRGRRAAAGELVSLSISDPGDAAVEDLRALRTSLQFVLANARNGIIAISGPAADVGKSFVSLNLAHLLATAERRVLLVDADLRRGTLHRAFGLERQPGLADVIAGSTTVEAAIRRTDVPRLDLLPTGPLPRNPAEQLASEAFQRMLAEVSRRYDLVIVDTPPILSVTDAALVARHAGVNLLVVRAGQHPTRVIAVTANRLTQNGVKVDGLILNDVRATAGRYHGYGRYRRHEERVSRLALH
jgi:tyrosine-protein kinase Etk/Wzc